MKKSLVFLCILVILFTAIGITIYCIGRSKDSGISNIDAHFSDMGELKASQWYDYLKCLYTDDQLKRRVPFSMSDFWIIQTKLLPNSITVGNIPKAPTSYHTLFTNLDWHVSSEKSVIYIYQYNSIPSTPSGETPVWKKVLLGVGILLIILAIGWGTRLVVSSRQPSATRSSLHDGFQNFKEKGGLKYTAIAALVILLILLIIVAIVIASNSPDPHFKLKNGLPSNSLVEVERGADSTGGYTWFYYMPGTGNWFNLGRTVVFSDHREAFSVAAKDGVKFTVDAMGSPAAVGTPADQLRLAKYFIKKKYDTIQFTQRSENVFKYEIFNLKNKQTQSAKACIPDIKTRGDQNCECSSKLPYLNCSTSGPCGKMTLPNI